jgi:hypothetical protein
MINTKLNLQIFSTCTMSSIICTFYQILLWRSNQGGWPEHVTRLGRMRNAYRILAGMREYLGDLGVN